MAERKVIVTQPLKKENSLQIPSSVLPLFEKDNYRWMIIGAVVVALGMLLMAGGKSEDPNQFNYDEIYSTTRITIAPILIILGLLIEIYAIFKRPKLQQV